MRGAAGPEPAATPAHLVLVDVASRPPADPGPPRLVRFADLVRQPLDRGRGSVRDVWTSTDVDRLIRWRLQVVELRDAAGLIAAPDDMNHAIVGFAGPQVAVRAGGNELNGPGRILHRDEVLTVRESSVRLSRPRLRASGSSSMILLSYSTSEDPPTLSFEQPDAAHDPADGLRITLALRGPIRRGEGEVPQGAALVSAPLAVPPRYR